MKTSERRLIFAFVAAAVAAAAALSVMTPLSGVHTVKSAVLSFIALLPYSATVVVGFGLPLYLLAKRVDRVKWWSALLAGAIGGAIVPTVVRFPLSPTLQESLQMLVVGLGAGLAFWLVLKVRRPKA